MNIEERKQHNKWFFIIFPF